MDTESNVGIHLPSCFLRPNQKSFPAFNDETLVGIHSGTLTHLHWMPVDSAERESRWCTLTYMQKQIRRRSIGHGTGASKHHDSNRSRATWRTGWGGVGRKSITACKLQLHYFLTCKSHWGPRAVVSGCSSEALPQGRRRWQTALTSETRAQLAHTVSPHTH